MVRYRRVQTPQVKPHYTTLVRYFIVEIFLLPYSYEKLKTVQSRSHRIPYYNILYCTYEHSCNHIRLQKFFGTKRLYCIRCNIPRLKYTSNNNVGFVIDTINMEIPLWDIIMICNMRKCII